MRGIINSSEELYLYENIWHNEIITEVKQDLKELVSM